MQKLALTAPLVAHFAPLVFGERRVRETAILRVTRSADISVRDIMDGCDADLRAVMERLLRRRRRLEPVRAQLQGKVTDEMRETARTLLGLPKRQLFCTSAPADLSFVLTMPGEFDLTGLTRPELPPARNVALQKGDYFAYLARHDLLLALPYQSVNPFVDLLYEAADDPDVVSIKITLYRLAGSSRIAAALAYAAEHGKQVQCLLELRARFDEQSNIDYSRMLEDAGCDILYGLTQYKVHTKLCLITRRCPGGICYYTQVGTGNYNEKTAEQYTDLMLLTSDPAIGRDAARTFDRLARGETVGETESLWLAPEGYKPQLMAHIEAQICLGAAGYIGIKVNAMKTRTSWRSSCARARRARRWSCSCAASAVCGRACPGARSTSRCAASSDGISSTSAFSSSAAGRRRKCSSARAICSSATPCAGSRPSPP